LGGNTISPPPSDLPPLDSASVHVQITILPSDAEYIAYVITDRGAFHIPIRLKPHDVKELNRGLQGALQQVANSPGRENAYDAALAQLARMGNYAFHRIFPDSSSQVASSPGRENAYDAAPAELARMGNYAFHRIFSDPSSQKNIRNALRAGTIVQIVSQDFFIPWELLYDDPLDARKDLPHYWGMKYIISQTTIQNARREAQVSLTAEKFWERGARGVLATNFQVPDWFDSSFSKILYRHLRSGKPIGQALLTIRRQLWRKKHNLLGLGYTLDSSPSITISRPKKMHQ